MKKSYLIYLISLFCCLTNIGIAQEVIKLKINPIKSSSNLVSMAQFTTDSPEAKAIATAILNQVMSNMEIVSLVAHPLNVEINEGRVPDFSTLEGGSLLVGSLMTQKTSGMEIKIRLWGVSDQSQLFGKYYTTNKNNWRKIAAIISDEIYKTLTGDKIGLFDSSIVYTSESGSIKRRIKRMILMNLDGSSRVALTNGDNLVLTPVFSKIDNEIACVEYGKNGPKITLYNMRTFRKRKVGNFAGMTFAPSFHPNKNQILLSTAINGNTEIYSLDLDNGAARRLTYSPAIDTTASWSPDGKWIAFASDRSGSQKIYLMDSNGENLTQITSAPGEFAKPTWSHDGKWISFVRIVGRKFSIGVVSPTTGAMRIVKTAYLIEGVRWSPNGRFLLYTKQLGIYGTNSLQRLYILDLATGKETALQTPAIEGASDPDWLMNS